MKNRLLTNVVRFHVFESRSTGGCPQSLSHISSQVCVLNIVLGKQGLFQGQNTLGSDMNHLEYNWNRHSIRAGKVEKDIHKF